MRIAATVLPPDSTSQTPPTCRERSDRSRPCCPVSPTAAASVLTATAQSMLPILLTAAAQRTSRSRSRSARRCRPSWRSRRPRPASILIPIQNLSQSFRPAVLLPTVWNMSTPILKRSVSSKMWPPRRCRFSSVSRTPLKSGNRPITPRWRVRPLPRCREQSQPCARHSNDDLGGAQVQSCRSSCNSEVCLPCSSGEIAGHSMSRQPVV